MSIRILIADDHGVLRDGLRALLDAECDMVVVGEAADGETTLQQALALRPDVVLLDMAMPGATGLQTLSALREQAPEVRVLVLTVYEDSALLQQCLRAGAAGYVVKRAVVSDVIAAIRAVARGDVYVHPSLLRTLLADGQTPVPPVAPGIDPLSPRERAVLQCVAQGYTSRQIAEMWTVSVRTVESHRANLMAKLGLRSRVELVRYALEHGYLQPAQWR